MPLFKCAECGSLENTALGDYWYRTGHEKKPPRCSECAEGKWHGRFDKITPEAGGYIEGNDGFLYKPDEIAPGGYFYPRVKPKVKDPQDGK